MGPSVTDTGMMPDPDDSRGQSRPAAIPAGQLSSPARTIASSAESDEQLMTRLDSMLQHIVGESFEKVATTPLSAQERNQILKDSVEVAARQHQYEITDEISKEHRFHDFPPTEIPQREIDFLVVRGYRHRRRGEDCQDAYVIVSDAQHLVAVGLDGISSSKTSGFGAQLIARRVAPILFDELKNCGKALPTDPEFRGRIHGQLVIACHDLLCELGTPADGYDVRSDGTYLFSENPMATTVQLLFQTPHWVAQMGLDDGYSINDGKILSAAKIRYQEEMQRKIPGFRTHVPNIARLMESLESKRNQPSSEDFLYRIYLMKYENEVAKLVHTLPKMIETAEDGPEGVRDFLEKFTAEFPTISEDLQVARELQKLMLDEDTDDDSALSPATSWSENKVIDRLRRLLRMNEARALRLENITSTRDFVARAKTVGTASDGLAHIDCDPERTELDTDAWPIKLPLGVLLRLPREARAEVVEAYNGIVIRADQLELEYQQYGESRDSTSSAVPPEDLESHPGALTAIRGVLTDYLEFQKSTIVVEDDVEEKVLEALELLSLDEGITPAEVLQELITGSVLWRVFEEPPDNSHNNLDLDVEGAEPQANLPDPSEIDTVTLDEAEIDVSFARDELLQHVAGLNIRLLNTLKDVELSEHRETLLRHGIDVSGVLHRLCPVSDDIFMVLLHPGGNSSLVNGLSSPEKKDDT